MKKLEDLTFADDFMFSHRGLPQRMRYYQSLMDIDALLKGRKYAEMKENCVIFICIFDPFGEDMPEYFFENRCREKQAEIGRQKL